MKLQIIFNVLTGKFDFIREQLGELDGGRADTIYLYEQLIDGGVA
jgi:hypothetical protein